jgi:glycosyltransferase involved in cell wall biosynthesis
MAPLRLSICIATFRRGNYIAETLNSIVQQLVDGVELIVVDGASPDNTCEVLAPYAAEHSRLTYVREATNSGVDQDYDKAIGYAAGKYCWLMSDDDLLLPGAVDRILRELESQPDLVVANAKVMNADLSVGLNPRLLDITADQRWDTSGGEGLFAQVAPYLSFIGGVIVRRDFWQQRAREPFFGSLFIHVGVLFQAPAVERAVVLADPLIVIRYGNAMWSGRSFEIWMFKWPQLIWSFDHFSEAARARVVSRFPFTSPKRLLFWRAIGSYSQSEYENYLRGAPPLRRALVQAFIARLPGKLANLCCGVYYLLLPGKQAGMQLYDLARASHAAGLSRWLAQARRWG